MPVSPKRRKSRSPSTERHKRKKDDPDERYKKNKQFDEQSNKKYDADKRSRTNEEDKERHRVRDSEKKASKNNSFEGNSKSQDSKENLSRKHSRRKSKSPRRREESPARRERSKSASSQRRDSRETKIKEEKLSPKIDDLPLRKSYPREKQVRDGYDKASHKGGERSGERRRERNGEREGEKRRFEVKREVKTESVKEEYGKPGEQQAPQDAIEKQKANFERSGKLAEDTNVYKGVVIKYNEPAEARKPGRRWRLYPFKGEQSLPIIHLHRQSAYMIGRDRKISEIPVDHPSCSKQHAVFQFRVVSYTKKNGDPGRQIKPYIIDLESANGTFLNEEKLKPRRYVELFEKDVLRFGFSQRKYVLLHAKTDTSQLEEDDEEEEEKEEEEEEGDK